jgi:chitosanase
MKKTTLGNLPRAALLALLLVPLGIGCGASGSSPGSEEEDGGSSGSDTGGAGGKASTGSGGKSGKGGSGGTPSTGSGGKGGSAPSDPDAGMQGDGGSPGTGGTAPATGGTSGGDGGTSGGDGGAPGAGGTSGGTGGTSGGTGGTTGGGQLGTGADCTYTDDKQFCACVNATCGGDTLSDKTKMLRSIYCGQCMGGSTCVGRASDAGGAIGICKALPGLTDGQKKKAAGLTSIWENSTPNLQYGYSEDIGDGRGYTSGRAGFCTGTGDAIVVVQCYAAAKPGNPLEKFIPELIRIEQKFVSSGGKLQGDTSGLGGYTTAWKSSGNDPVFRTCQDSAVDAIYYGAALSKATAKKFKTALTVVSLWDAQIMHGEADPKFGTAVMMAEADTKVKLSDPPTAMEESEWLGAFHTVRARIMTTRGEWKSNMYRIATYEMLRRDGKMDFKGCVQTGSVGASNYWPGYPGNHSPSFNVCGD